MSGNSMSYKDNIQKLEATIIKFESNNLIYNSKTSQGFSGSPVIYKSLNKG